jgi:hypothetical protein
VIGYDTGSDACASEPCENDPSAGEFVAASVMTGSTLGAGIGALVGAEHWERLTIPVRVAVCRDRDRMTLALAIAF